MAIVRSFDRPFEVTDLTEDLLIVPNTYGLINELGIFRSESVTQHSITVEANAKTLSLLTDQVRGSRTPVARGSNRNLRSFPVPHFPVDDALSPSDLQGKRAYGKDAAETEAEVMMRKVEFIRKAHAITVEYARAYAITQGAIYAPNGTVSANFYTDFGVTRKEVNFDLTNSATDVLAKQREVIDHIQENIGSGEVPTGFIALCSPEFFDAYIAQAGVREAYKFFQSTQNPLRDGLRSGRYSVFTHGDVTLYRYIGSYQDAAGASHRIIPQGDAYYIPTGTQDTFVSYYSPADKLDLVNTLGEEAYMFTYRDPKGSKVEIESEHNAIHLVRRPAAIVRAYK